MSNANVLKCKFLEQPVFARKKSKIESKSSVYLAYRSGYKTANVTKRRNYKTATTTKWRNYKMAKLQNGDCYKTAKLQNGEK